MRAVDAFIDVLQGAGIDTLWGLPGSTEAVLLDALHERHFGYVLALHESIAVAMADGYARTSGRPAAVGLHTSVGTLNGLSQIMNAGRVGSPLVVTAGNKDREVLTDEGFCALPGLLDAARTVTKWSHQSLSADAVAFDLAHAIRVASAPPRGPVYLSVPNDLFTEEAGGHQDAAVDLVTGAAVESSPSRADMAAAADLLRRATWPVLVVGGAARGAAAEIARLSEAAGIPVLMTAFPDLYDPPIATSDARYLGTYGEVPEVLEGCDLVVAAGARPSFPYSSTSRPPLPKGAAVVHLHDDPAEIGRITRADVGLAGSVRLGLAGILEELETPAGAIAPDAREDRERRVRALHDMRDARRASELAAAEGQQPMRVERVAHVMERLLPPDAVVVDEAIRSSKPLLRHMTLSPAHRLLTCSGGVLGWGTPAAIGAAAASPRRAAVAVVGDGSFHFSVQAVWTAVQLGVSVVVVVLDNGGYLAVKRAIESHLGVPYDPRVFPGTEIHGIDHAMVARGYGARSVSAADEEAFGDAFAQALADGGVTVVHAPVAQVRP